MALGLRCSAACGIFPDQGSNPCPLHWQADPQPLRHQGSPGKRAFMGVRVNSALNARYTFLNSLTLYFVMNMYFLLPPPQIIALFTF